MSAKRMDPLTLATFVAEGRTVSEEYQKKIAEQAKRCKSNPMDRRASKALKRLRRESRSFSRKLKQARRDHWANNCRMKEEEQRLRYERLRREARHFTGGNQPEPDAKDKVKEICRFLWADAVKDVFGSKRSHLVAAVVVAAVSVAFGAASCSKRFIDHMSLRLDEGTATNVAQRPVYHTQITTFTPENR